MRVGVSVSSVLSGVGASSTVLPLLSFANVFIIRCVVTAAAANVRTRCRRLLPLSQSVTVANDRARLFMPSSPAVIVGIVLPGSWRSAGGRCAGPVVDGVVWAADAPHHLASPQPIAMGGCRRSVPDEHVRQTGTPRCGKSACRQDCIRTNRSGLDGLGTAGADRKAAKFAVALDTVTCRKMAESFDESVPAGHASQQQYLYEITVFLVGEEAVDAGGQIADSGLQFVEPVGDPVQTLACSGAGGQTVGVVFRRQQRRGCGVG